MCTLALNNDLIDDGQPRDKPCLRNVKPNHVLKPVFSPRLAPSIKSLVNPIVHVRSRLK